MQILILACVLKCNSGVADLKHEIEKLDTLQSPSLRILVYSRYSTKYIRRRILGERDRTIGNN